jgi:hypothetical protein
MLMWAAVMEKDGEVRGVYVYPHLEAAERDAVVMVRMGASVTLVELPVSAN